jgi:hypothetical protein
MRNTAFGKIAALTALAVLSGGCATASKPAAMAVAAPTGIVNTHAASVSLSVAGGKETSSAGASQISNADFAEAIRASIEASRVFAQVLGTDAADYRLDVMIVRLSQPMFGFDMKVDLEANWTLSRHRDGKVLWQKPIATTYTATTKDAFAGVTRLRLANEGAARANIEEALRQISRLTLDTAE